METLNALLSVDFNYITIGIIVVFYSLEQLLNNQFNFSKRPLHLVNNSLFLIAFIILNIFWASVTVYSIEWMNKQNIGLFYFFSLPLWLKLVLGVALIDFVTYWFHRMSHKVPLLWRFHRVHHSDTSVDSSTFFRAHPFELLFWFGSSNIIAAGIFGLDVMTLGVYFLVGTPFSILEHTNLRFPKWLDKSFGLIFTTPNQHKVHHEQDQHFTDSNYADIFILWDRLFGTYKYKEPELVKFGLKEFEEEKKQRFWYLFKSPFFNIHRVSSSTFPKSDALEPDIQKEVRQRVI